MTVMTLDMGMSHSNNWLPPIFCKSYPDAFWPRKRAHGRKKQMNRPIAQTSMARDVFNDDEDRLSSEAVPDSEEAFSGSDSTDMFSDIFTLSL